MHQMKEEQLLVRKILDGDQTAFRSLVVQYQRLVEHMVGRLVDSREDREDLCQDIFTKVYFNLHRFRFDSRLSTWVATIAYRESVNFIRKRSRRPVLSGPDAEEKLRRLSDGERPDIQAESRDVHERLEECIRELPEIYRTILTLYHLDGFKYEEIAGVTGLPDGTVKSYLFRARQTLKKKMESSLKEEIHDEKLV